MICNLNDKFINQRFGHDFHHQIIKTDKLGIYTVIPKSITKLYHPFHSCIISKGHCLSLQPNVYTEKLDPGTHLHLYFRLFNKVSCQKITSDLTIFESTTIHLFGYLTISKHPPLQLIKNTTKLSSGFIKVVNFTDNKNS